MFARLHDFGPEEIVAIVTKNGKCKALEARDEQTIRERADEIQEMMSRVMKVDRYRQGYWIWKINTDWREAHGEKII